MGGATAGTRVEVVSPLATLENAPRLPRSVPGGSATAGVALWSVRAVGVVGRTRGDPGSLEMVSVRAGYGGGAMVRVGTAGTCLPSRPASSGSGPSPPA